MEMTFTELREQVLANAAQLFPTLTEDHLLTHNLATAAPPEIFSIVTMKVIIDPVDLVDSDGHVFSHKADDKVQAFLVYERRTVIQARPRSSRHKALQSLLDATETALAIAENAEVACDRRAVGRAMRRGEFEMEEGLLGLGGLRIGRR